MPVPKELYLWNLLVMNLRRSPDQPVTAITRLLNAAKILAKESQPAQSGEFDQSLAPWCNLFISA
jgi:hypothetical protein